MRPHPWGVHTLWCHLEKPSNYFNTSLKLYTHTEATTNTPELESGSSINWGTLNPEARGAFQGKDEKRWESSQGGACSSGDVRWEGARWMDAEPAGRVAEKGGRGKGLIPWKVSQSPLMEGRRKDDGAGAGGPVGTCREEESELELSLYL